MSQANDNDIQQSNNNKDALVEENKTLRWRVNKLTKKAKQASHKSAKWSARFACFAADLRRKRRQQVSRLSSACAGYRKRIAALETSSQSAFVSRQGAACLLPADASKVDGMVTIVTEWPQPENLFETSK